MKSLQSADKPNVLARAKELMTELPINFREKACFECGWSEATFYRKLRSKKPFSRADQDKLIEIVRSCSLELLELCNSIRA